MRNNPARRSVISAIGAAGAAVVLGSRSAGAQSPSTLGRFQPTRHPEDAWFDAMPGKHRTVIDSFSANGAGNALLFANNLFLSNAVRMHRTLRAAGVAAELHVIEAASHGGFHGAPEEEDLNGEVRRFVWTHWVRSPGADGPASLP